MKNLINTKNIFLLSLSMLTACSENKTDYNFGKSKEIPNITTLSLCAIAAAEIYGDSVKACREEAFMHFNNMNYLNNQGKRKEAIKERDKGKKSFCKSELFNNKMKCYTRFAKSARLKAMSIKSNQKIH